MKGEIIGCGECGKEYPCECYYCQRGKESFTVHVCEQCVAIKTIQWNKVKGVICYE